MNKAIITKPVLIIPRNSLPQQALDGLVRERGGTPMMFFEETPLYDDYNSLPQVVDNYRSLYVVGVLAALPRQVFSSFRRDKEILAFHDVLIPSSKLGNYNFATREAAAFFNRYLHSQRSR